ncbi:hypothetical protein GCM10009827_072990 [Dactylosporangium maewongense]|uniref:Uncharacterized protein n=1 Tax=Dactylosporangium maewongense TaxID=634393 RepID=A0ABP4ME58_9ACTN
MSGALPLSRSMPQPVTRTALPTYVTVSSVPCTGMSRTTGSPSPPPSPHAGGGTGTLQFGAAPAGADGRTIALNKPASATAPT